MVEEDILGNIVIGSSVVVNQCIVVADGIREDFVILHQPCRAQGVLQVVVAHVAHGVALLGADGSVIVAVDHAEAFSAAAAVGVVVAVRGGEVHACSGLHETIECVGVTRTILPAHHAAELCGGAADEGAVEAAVVQH